MKRVITAQTVKEAHAAGKAQLYAPIKETIITPEARTIAKDLGIRFVEYQGAAGASAGTSSPLDEATVRKIVERVITALPPEKRNQEQVRSVVTQVLARYLKEKA